MTENERREQDTITREDIVLRVLAVAGIIATFLTALLMLNP